MKCSFKYLVVSLMVFQTFFLTSDDRDSRYYYPRDNSRSRRQMSSTPKYSAKNYNYLLGKMKGLNDSLLEMHFKLYEGYVKNTNLLIESLNKMVESGEDRTIGFMALKRRFGWEYDGMVLHELYFDNLGGTGRLSSVSSLYKKIIRDFGSYENWRKEFIATGMIRGIGWVVLCEDPIKGHLYNIWINEHDLGHLAGGKPLLVMDVWEHAYITEFGLARSSYIDTFLQNVNWDVVLDRFESKKKDSKGDSQNDIVINEEAKNDTKTS